MKRKIIKVEAMEDQPYLITVEFDNGNIILLMLESKLSDPLFAEIEALSNPKTDGERVFWINGASLTVDEIMDMLQSGNGR